MRPALHPHSIPDDAYATLPHDLANSAPTYPTFAASLHHHADALPDHNAPALHHTLPSQHAHIELHLDPNLSPETSRQYQASSAQHDFTEPSTPSDPKNGAPPHNPPPILPNTASPGHFDMLPPPPSTHPTWHALHAYAQTHASAHGYALSINTTAKNRSRIKLACVCYGAPKNTHKLTPETRVRKNRVSYKTGCKMWVEGKKGEDGTWVLRVGEGAHNHEGRPSEGWAVQRKRTWGVKGGRVGVGGVTAMEEQQQEDEVPQDGGGSTQASHSLERGGLVWKIVEQEMLRKGVSSVGQGRDRGVGRTVAILQERLPGIRIFKRDVYNIRAQIKRARNAAGQQLGEGLSDESASSPPDADAAPETPPLQEQTSFLQIDPSLGADPGAELGESEVERLRREVNALQHALALRTKEVEEKSAENEGLRVQLEMAHLAMYGERRGE